MTRRMLACSQTPSRSPSVRLSPRLPIRALRRKGQEPDGGNTTDYKVVSLGHRPKEASLTEKAKELVGAVDAIGKLDSKTTSERSDRSAADTRRRGAESYIPTLPVVAFKFSDEFVAEYPRVKQVSIQKMLRQREWIVPK